MDFVALAQECAPWVAPQTMAAIVKTESAFRPLAIGVNRGPKLARQPETKAEAVATAKLLIANGYNIDLGLGQVNSANLSKIGLSIEDAFDPCKNLAASADILRFNYQTATKKVSGEQAALRAALSAYNTGSFTRGFSNGYVQKVLTNAGASSSIPLLPPTTLGAQGFAGLRTAQAVKLKAEGQNEASAQTTGVTVYGNSETEQKIMVY